MTITTAIEINPNLRFANDETSVEVDDIASRESLVVGALVAVYERTTRLYGRATITRIDDDDLTLAVDWDGLRIFGADGGVLGLELTPDLAVGLLNNRFNLPLSFGVSSGHFIGPSNTYVPATATTRTASSDDVLEAIA